MKKLIIALVFICFLLPVRAQMSSMAIDTLVEETLKAFDVPGIAVGIVKDGKIIHAKGYGVRSLKTNLPVDENTLFGIASNSKAFTAFALGMLMDEGKLKWDDKVTDYIPEFKMYAPYVTAVFTIRDLLTHRSGLGLGAGDLMFFPEGSDFTIKDIIYNIRFLKAESSFRTHYDYDNNLYIVAGEIIHRVSGLTWEEFIEQRMMKPLGFDKSTASYNRIKNNKNFIDPHAPVNGKVEALVHDWSETANAAGGIQSNITDLTKWVTFLLNNGVLPNGKRIFSEKVLKDVWAPQTIIDRGSGNYNTHFSAYGLGWFLSDEKGYFQATHTGGLLGTVTQITLLPELNLGIIVLTNQQVGAAFYSITNTIKDSYLGIEKRDWVKRYSENVNRNNANAKKIVDEINAEIDKAVKNKVTIPADIYEGTFKDDWFGNIIITKVGNNFAIRSERSPRLVGELLFYKGNTFIAKWNDRSFDADAYVMFTLDENGKANGFTMKPVSPLTDFSFDFQHLNLKRVN